MSGEIAASSPPSTLKRRLSLDTVRGVVTEKGEKERKLSLSSLDEEYSPSVDEYIGGSVDDESSIQNEEDEEDCEEIEDLKKEGELPLEDLIVLYGLNKEDDYTKFKQESQDSETDTESVTHGVRMSMYDKDDWKKEISIGPEFQAEIPPLQDKSHLADERENEGDTLLWRPDKLNSEDLYKYLSNLYSKEELPIEDFHRDDEQALYNLHTHDYKVDSATQEEKRDCLYQSMRPWSKEECQNFELGLKMFGKQFHLIHKNNVASRKISEIIQFYYLWKKTERYDIFIRYSKIGSKRYIFNPGLSLDFERCSNGVLGEEEGVEVRTELTPPIGTASTDTEIVPTEPI